MIDFLPEVHEIMKLVEAKTGKQVVVTQGSDKFKQALGMSMAAVLPEQVVHTITYPEKMAMFKDSIVAHECGRMLRFTSIPDDERYIPIMMPAKLNTNYLRDVRDDAGGLDPLTEDQINERLDGWVQTISGQLGTWPADIRIEMWLHSEYPGLREVQAETLRFLSEREYPGLGLDQASSHPAKIYVASSAMSAALTYAYSKITGQDLMGPYKASDFYDLGLKLASVAMQEKRNDFHGDCETMKRWATILGISGCMEWWPYNNEIIQTKIKLNAYLF